jgi:hypothetical protein
MLSINTDEDMPVSSSKSLGPVDVDDEPSSRYLYVLPSRLPPASILDGIGANVNDEYLPFLPVRGTSRFAILPRWIFPW